MKRCSACGVEQPLENFNRDRYHGGVHPKCKTCHRAINQRRRDLKKSGEYAAKFRKQQGRCVICQEPFETLVVDHEHESGKVRDLLCNRHNLLVGYMEKSVADTLAALDYIERWAA